jgi:hypothetical protein
MHSLQIIGIKTLLGICLLSLILFVSCRKDDDTIDQPGSPVLTDFFPKSVLPGDTVTVEGKNFDAALSATKVVLGTEEINIVSLDGSEIRFVVPANASTGILHVTSGDITLDFSESLAVLSMYFLGQENINNTTHLKYWKNETSYDLATIGISESAVAMDVSGGDVYTAGDGRISLKTTAKYWVNGVGHDLTDGSFSAKAKGIRVVGDDVYVAGYEVNENGSFVGKLWKNGTVIFAGEANPRSIFYDVEIFQGSVYVAGYDEGLKATYWKDGVAVHLTNGDIQARVDDIKITEEGVFAVGFEGNSAMFWKNASGTALASASGSAQSSRAASIFLDEDNVYIGGAETASGNVWTAILWRNGEPTALTAPGINSGVSSVFVINGNVYCGGFETPTATDSAKGTYWRNGVSSRVTSAGNYGTLFSLVVAE